MARRPTNYVGATKRIDRKELANLGSGWAIQRKHDGIYVSVYLNGRGRIERLFMRSGAEVPAHFTSHIMGARVGNPHAELVGELDAMTDAADAAARQGPRRIHLFDCLHDGSRGLVRAPYRTRRDALYRMHAEVQVEAPHDDHRPAPWRRYRDPVLPGWRLCPIVEQAPLSALEREWERVKAEDLEGLVLVNQNAPAGARCSKLKLKEVDGIDARVVSVARTTITCDWRGMLMNVARGKHYVEVGEVVELKHCGFYAGGLPKFVRLSRVRRDLVLQ